VFLNDAASGATLGYYGTALENLSQRPASCSVYVPALDRVLKVSRSEILVIGSDKSVPLSDAEKTWLANQQLQIEFDSPIDSDNREIHGKYRIGSRLKGRFHFLKRNQLHPTYRLAIPSQGDMRKGKIEYFVPAERVLNREAVMSALAEILCVEPPDGDQSLTSDII
jgi:hypothetical protein